MAIAGITFDNATVTPKNDGGLFKGLGDRYITSGYVIGEDRVTIKQGYMVIGGRNIHISANEVITVNPTITNGYGRIKAKIDLTKTAGQQITLVEEYATSITGFASITQNDINESGNVYEKALCYFVVAPGSISENIYTKSMSMASISKQRGDKDVSADLCFNEGVYLVTNNTNGLPVNVTGYLEVITAKENNNLFMQRFTTKVSHVQYTRVFDGSTWSEWSAEKLTADRLPAHTHTYSQVSGGTMVIPSTNYGSTLPSSGTEGQIFFKI